MIDNRILCVCSVGMMLFCCFAAYAQESGQPKITNIPGGFFAEWSSPVELSAVNIGTGNTGAFEIMFDLPSVEAVRELANNSNSASLSPDVVFVLADYWIVREKPERAIPLYENLLKQGDLDERDSVKYKNNLAMLYSQTLKRHAEGLKVIDEALAAKKDDFELLDTKGLIYMNSGDPVSAIPSLERAVELSCQFPIYCMHLASALYQSGDISTARDHFDRVKDQLVTQAPRMTKENKRMFDELQQTLPSIGL